MWDKRNDFVSSNIQWVPFYGVHIFHLPRGLRVCLIYSNSWKDTFCLQLNFSINGFPSKVWMKSHSKNVNADESIERLTSDTMTLTGSFHTFLLTGPGSHVSWPWLTAWRRTLATWNVASCWSVQFLGLFFEEVNVVCWQWGALLREYGFETLMGLHSN